MTPGDVAGSTKMGTFIVLLRAVNVGGSAPVPMPTLRALLTRAGCTRVRTFLQSGNAVVESSRRSPIDVERLLDRDLPARLGVTTEFFVRSAVDWERVIAENPFPREAVEDPAHLLVTFLKTAPSPAGWAALDRAIVGRERTHAGDRVAYVVYPDGIARSRLTAARVEAALGVRGTSRNWNTVRRLADLARHPPPIGDGDKPPSHRRQ